MTKETEIPSIHNYCDRWCERCTFTSRCAVYAAEQEQTDEEKDLNNDVFWRSLSNNFAVAKQMLFEKAEELGIEIEEIDEAEARERRILSRQVIDADTLTKLSARYIKESKKLIEVQDIWMRSSPLDGQTQVDYFEIIGWYQIFISAKIQRGLSGILDLAGNEDAEVLNDSQSDANGSIKVALIAIQRSEMAWSALQIPQNSALIDSMLFLLKRIRQSVEEKFPHARDFIRPGFDEIETVM